MQYTIRPEGRVSRVDISMIDVSFVYTKEKSLKNPPPLLSHSPTVHLSLQTVVAQSRETSPPNMNRENPPKQKRKYHRHQTGQRAA